MKSRPAPGALLFLAARGIADDRLIAVLLVLAVAAGVGFQVPNTANLLGYEAELLDRGLREGYGDVRVRPRTGERFPDVRELVARIRAAPGVTAVVPVLTVPGAVSHGGRLVGTAITGNDADAARPPYRLLSGAPLQPGDRDGVLVGSGLATKLGVGVGDRVSLRLVDGPRAGGVGGAGEAAQEAAPAVLQVTVRGIAAGSFGTCAVESVLADRGFLGAELGLADGADLLLVHLEDHFAAPALAARIAALSPDAEVLSWQDDSAFLPGAVRTIRVLATISGTMVVLAVLIPVWALLYVQALQRRRQVAVLQALGFGRGEVFTIHLCQAALVGVVGVGLGLLLGYALVRFFQLSPIFTMDGFVVRPVMAARAFIEPAVLVLLTTILAGVLPAWRAARIDPARILRGAE